MKGKKMKLKSKYQIIYGKSVCFLVVVLIFIFTSTISFAKDTETEVEGELYEFDEDSQYELTSENTNWTTEEGADALGTFLISGDFEENGMKDEVFRYDIKNGNLNFHYKYDISRLETDEANWHIVEDKSKEVNGVNLDDKIMKGALLVQSSLDGVIWLDDVIMTNIFSKEGTAKEIVYKTNNIQQQNGCFYRVIIAYSL